MDTGLHTIRLVLSGAFDRFPGLQVIIGHMGESLPFMLGRLEERFAGIATSLPNFGSKIALPIGEYFRRNIHITTSGFFTNPPLTCSVEVFGIDRIMFAVDYPFSLNTDVTQNGRRSVRPATGTPNGPVMPWAITRDMRSTGVPAAGANIRMDLFGKSCP